MSGIQDPATSTPYFSGLSPSVLGEGGTSLSSGLGSLESYSSPYYNPTQDPTSSLFSTNGTSSSSSTDTGSATPSSSLFGTVGQANNAYNLGSNAYSAASNPSSFFSSGIFSPTTQGGFSPLNIWGEQNLGTGIGSPSVGSLGGDLTNTTASGILSGAGEGGLAGSITGSLLGETGGQHPIGSAIGGAIGGAIGSAVIPIPILGGVIGGALGGAIGGLFGGGGVHHPADSFDTTATSQGGYSSNLGLMSDNMDKTYAQNLSNAFTPYLQALNQAGINTQGVRIGGGYDTGTSFLFSGSSANPDDLGKAGTKQITFNPSDPQAAVGAFQQLATQIATQQSPNGKVDPAVTQAIANLAQAQLHSTTQGAAGANAIGGANNNAQSAPWSVGAYSAPTQMIPNSNGQTNQKWDDFMANYKSTQGQA